MASLNKVTLLGNLGKTPEIYRFSSGTLKASFSMATTDGYKNKEGQWIEETEWHNVSVYGKLAEVAEKYLHKGSKLYLEGIIRTRSWEDSSGVKKYRTEIEVRDKSGKIVLVGSRPDQSAVITKEGSSNNFSSTNVSNTPAVDNTPPPPPADEVDDDLPF
ncbi:MAG: single-stranded DNA-binding protein [Chitinophagales bacterium]